MNAPLVKRILPPIIPYMTIGIGLLVFHNAWLAILGYHAGMVAVISLSKTGITIKRAFQGKRYWVLFITALAGAGGGILLYILWPLLSVPDDINSYIRSIGLNERTWPVFLTYFILTNPLIEEYYWRGYLAGSAKGIALNFGISLDCFSRANRDHLAHRSILRPDYRSLVLETNEQAWWRIAGIYYFSYNGRSNGYSDDLLHLHEIGRIYAILSNC